MSQAVAANPRLQWFRQRRNILIIAVAVVLVIAISLVAVSCLNRSDTTAPTVRVDRGPVALAVNASGNISPSGQQNLGFADGGTVTELLVNVGDRVEAGQTLARIDDAVARATLAQRRAGLAQQLANLDKLQGATTVEQAQASLDQAQNAEDATQQQVDATNTANASATQRAQTQLAFDQKSLDRAEDQLAADRAACRASPRTTTATPPPTTVTQAGTGGGGTTTPPTTTARPPATNPVPTTTPRTVTTKVKPVADSSPLGDASSDTALADGRTSPACGRILSDRQAVEQAQGAVVTSRTNLDAAQQREQTDAAAGQVSIENARTAVVNAQNQLDTASNDAPADVAAQAAQVDDARAQITIAQKDVDQTVITAPVAGTITAINGAPGEVVAAPSAVTPLAPGGRAPLPQATGNVSGPSSTVSAQGAGAFVVLDAADPFQLVVPFEEADAARIAPGQQVDVDVDALPGDPLTGAVTSVAPAGQDLSGIVSYYATVVVQGGADRLRNGQTAEANVRVESVPDTLRVPTSAVRRVDGKPTVTVAGPDGQPVSRPFLAGLVGDDYTEVRSGLTDGDQVQLPQATVTTTTGPNGPPPGN
jgi:HlyD family secretion protein